MIEITELPASYGRTRLILMDIEPFSLHAYWEVASRDRHGLRALLDDESASAAWVLRFYDVTDALFAEANTQGYFDITVDPEAGNWYVNLWSSEKSYYAELGLRAADGRFQPVCRSNVVHVPCAEPSPRYRPEWLRIEGAMGPMDRVPQPDAPLEWHCAEPGATAGPEAGANATPGFSMLEARSAEAEGEAAAPPRPRPILPPIGEEDIRRRYGELIEGVGPAEVPGGMHRSPGQRTIPEDPFPVPIAARQRTAPSSGSVGGAEIDRDRSSHGSSKGR